MNINQVLQKNKEKLKKDWMDNVDFEAGSILSLALKKPREFLFTHPEYQLNVWEALKNRFLLWRRSSGYPLAYLSGSKEFFGLEFFVNKKVLVPRPETELMVEEALRIARDRGVGSIIDVGTGSGCLAITLALKLPKASCWGLDISPAALKIARSNAKRHKAKGVRFILSNLIKEVIGQDVSAPVIILANLPYLTPKQVKGSPSIKKEPKLALLGGDDGLEYYHLLFKQIRISRFPRPIFLLCEIDETQKHKMSELIGLEFPSAKYEIKKDLKGLDRLVVIRLGAPRSGVSPRFNIKK